MLGPPDHRYVVVAGEENWTYIFSKADVDASLQMIPYAGLFMPMKTRASSKSVAISFKDGLVTSCRLSTSAMSQDGGAVGSTSTSRMQEQSLPCDVE